MFTVETTEKYGIINKEGKTILDTVYESIQIQGTSIFALKESESYEFDINGNKKEYNDNYKLITEPTENSNYNIIVKIDDSGSRYGVSDSEGNVLIECEY